MTATTAPGAEVEIRRKLDERGWAVVRITGTSMEPTLVPGDTVRLVAHDDLRVGDVVTFALGDFLFTHRIAKLSAASVVCQGDNRLYRDPPVPRSHVLGKVVELVGGEPVRTLDPRFSMIGVRRSFRQVRRLVDRGGDELRLMARQLRGLADDEIGGLSKLGAPAPDVLRQAHLLSPAEALSLDFASGAWMTSPCVVPAGIYSRLQRGRRLELLRSLPGGSVTVCGFSRSAMGPFAKSAGLLRRLAGALGVSLGNDGDAVASAGGPLPSGYIHYFRPHDLADEVMLARPDSRVGVSHERTPVGIVVCVHGRAATEA